MIILVCLFMFLAGCAAPLHERYPDTCDLTQPDKTGPGYTVGKFPCKLTHYEGKK